MNKVYLVQAHEVYEDISTIRNEIFATKEMAQKCFDEKVKWYKDDIGDDGEIIDDTNDCFSWILESGYADNSIEVCIQECEVQSEKNTKYQIAKEVEIEDTLNAIINLQYDDESISEEELIAINDELQNALASYDSYNEIYNEVLEEILKAHNIKEI